MRNMQLQDHDRDDDRKHAVAKSFQTSFFHAAVLPLIYEQSGPRPSAGRTYSDRRILTGLTAAARMAWTLIVANVINTHKIHASTNTHQFSPIR